MNDSTYMNVSFLIVVTSRLLFKALHNAVERKLCHEGWTRLYRWFILFGDDKLKLNTRLNIPGLNYFPKFAASDADQKASLASNDGIAFYWKEGQKDGDAGYQYYVDQSQTILNNVTNTQSDVKDFDVNTLGECSNPQASWDAGKPCIYFRLNRVIDWQPVGLFKPEDGTIFAKDGPKKAMVKGATYVRCEAKDSESGEFVDAPFKYFGGDANGGDGYFPADFFPYKGKKAQPKYESPIVAVQVTNLEADNDYSITCRAFGADFVHDDRKEAQAKFHLKMDN